jgi:hypothetical protein
VTAPSTALALTAYVPPEEDRGDLLFDPAAFRHAMDVAGFLATSQMLPQTFRGKPADVLIGMQLAHRMRMDTLTVLQSMQVINGSPSWKATFVIARINASKKFTGLDWRITGEGTRDLKVVCYAKRHEDGKEVSAEATWAMAEAEGWTKNPKYRSIPLQMLRYRSATFFGRSYAPEVMLGLPVADELEDMAAAEAVIADPAATQVAPAAPPRGVAGIAAALSSAPSAPTTSANSAAPSGAGQAKEQEPKKDPIKEALLADLRELFRTDADGVTEACRQHGTAPNQIGRLGPEKLSAILKTLRPPVDPNPPAGQEPVTAVDPDAPSEDTQAAIGEWCETLDSQGKGDRVTKALADLGIDPEQGPATEAQAQALLAALKLAGA